MSGTDLNLAEALTRITPIVGTTLRGRRIALQGHDCAWAFDLLASCGAQPALRDAPVDALLVDAAHVAPAHAATCAQTLNAPVIVLCRPHNGWAAGHVWLCRPGDSAPPLPRAIPVGTDLTGRELNAAAADLVRAWFTRDTPYAPAGWETRLAAGRTVLSLGAHDWPWRVAWDTPARFAARTGAATLPPPVYPDTPPPFHALLFGLGSLGAWAALALRPHCTHFTLVDPDTVAPANLARQAYRAAHLGHFKTHALATQLADTPCTAVPMRVDGTALDALLTEAQARAAAAQVPLIAVLATGSDDDFELARALYAHGIPHVAGRCYARARYYELIIVAPDSGPCYECVRGRVFTGTQPPLTPEARAAYDDPSALDTLTTPATRLEIGRPALALARLAGALATRPHPAWLATPLAAGRTCLLGANVVADDAYGLHEPLQVAAYGLPDLIGVQAHSTCAACGRVAPVQHRV